jgi:hypothetical protein
MNTAVVVFAYNRADHLSATLEALDRANLIRRFTVKIFVDGPRQGETGEDQAAVLDVARRFRAQAVDRYLVTVVQGMVNRGLARSISETITEQFAFHDRLIVIEDDIVLDPLALLYAEAQLTNYQHDSSIQSIGLHAPVQELVAVPYLTPRMMCWGWATWKGKWTRFLSKTSCQYFIENNNEIEDYYSYFVGLDSFGTLKKCLYEAKDVWACRWVLSHVVHQSFCLLPPKTLTVNIGLDGSGQNCGRALAELKHEPPVTYADIECYIRSKPFQSAQLMQLFASRYDKQCLRTALDRNHPTVINRLNLL